MLSELSGCPLSFLKVLHFVCALWAERGHMHSQTKSGGVSPVSQDTILKHSESVLLTPTAREEDGRMATGTCAV